MAVYARLNTNQKTMITKIIWREKLFHSEVGNEANVKPICTSIQYHKNNMVSFYIYLFLIITEL